jgi:hypothetical protein
VIWGLDRAEYNLRQLSLARRAIDGYVESDRSLRDLGSLIETLEALGAALESPDVEWLDRFEDEMLTLETVYAVRLDRGGELTDQDKSLLTEPIDRLQPLVDSAIASNEALVSDRDSQAGGAASATS